MSYDECLDKLENDIYEQIAQKRIAALLDTLKPVHVKVMRKIADKMFNSA